MLLYNNILVHEPWMNHTHVNQADAEIRLSNFHSYKNSNIMIYYTSSAVWLENQIIVKHQASDLHVIYSFLQLRAYEHVLIKIWSTMASCTKQIQTKSLKCALHMKKYWVTKSSKNDVAHRKHLSKTKGEGLDLSVPVRGCVWQQSLGFKRTHLFVLYLWY